MIINRICIFILNHFHACCLDLNYLKKFCFCAITHEAIEPTSRLLKILLGPFAAYALKQEVIKAISALSLNDARERLELKSRLFFNSVIFQLLFILL